MCDRKLNEKGFSTAWILGFVLLILTIGGVFYDISMSLVYRHQYVMIADRAAHAGATYIDEDYLTKTGVTQLDPVGATQRCQDVLSSQLSKIVSGTCTVMSVSGTNDVIQVTVKGEKHYGFLLRFVPDPGEFEVNAYARPSCSDRSC